MGFKKKLLPEQKWAIWRRRVFKRDRYTCQLCGKKGGYLEPHHIKRKADYPRLKYNVYNGITLCGSTNNYVGCHEMVTGHEYEWEPLLKKIRQKKLTELFLKRFLSDLSPAVVKRVEDLKRDFIWDKLLKRAKAWKKRSKKKKK